MKYLKLIALFPAQMIIWAVAFAIETAFEILGWFVVPFLYKYRSTPIEDMPWWSQPWVNPEDWHGGLLQYDGSVPPWYIKKMGKNDFWTFYKYHAFRNAANGLRSMGMSVKVRPEKIEYWTPNYHRHYEFWYRMDPKIKFYYAWDGVFSGMKLMWRYNEERFGELKLGWRIAPGDTEGLRPDSVKGKIGAAFASKLAPWRRV